MGRQYTVIDRGRPLTVPKKVEIIHFIRGRSVTFSLVYWVLILARHRIYNKRRRRSG